MNWPILEIMGFNYHIEDIEKGMGYIARPSLQNENKDAQGKDHKTMLGVHTISDPTGAF